MKRYIRNPVNPATITASLRDEERAADRDTLRRLKRDLSEHCNSRRMLDEDIAEEIEDYTLWGPVDHRHSIKTFVPSERPRSGFQAAAAMAVSEGLPSAAEHGIVIRPDRMKVIYFIECPSLEVELEDEAEFGNLLIELGIDKIVGRPDAVSQIVVFHATGKPGAYAGGPRLGYRPEVITGCVLKRRNFVKKPEAKAKPAAPQVANQPKKRFDYKCTECGSGFTCKVQLSTAPGAAPIRCEKCRKARPIHSHNVAKSAAQ